MTDRFTHLHIHTENSMLDGMIRIPQLVERVVKLDQNAVAITDHGNISGAPELYMEAKKHGINPIVGSEFYVAQHGAAPERDPETGKVVDPSEQRKYWHLILLARNYEGYKTLVDLSTESNHPDNFYYRPRLDHEILESHVSALDNLVCLSGCWQGEITLAIREKRPRDAVRALAWYRRHFKHFYLEIQDHKTEEDRWVNRQIVRLANKYGCPYVVTGDSHYLDRSDADAHSMLLAIQTGSAYADNDRFDFTGTGYHVKSHRAMENSIAYLGTAVARKACETAFEIGQSIQLSIPLLDNRTWHIPEWRSEGYDNPQSELEALVWEFAQDNSLGKEYRRRFRHELATIGAAGVAAYLLIVRDIIQWAWDNNVRVGIARGSVGGCTVAWALGITKLDSIRYDLMFDRFLSPARPKLPDIDVDFSKEQREEVIGYIEAKYGKEFTAHIGTFGRMGARSAVKSVAGALRIPFMEANMISQLVPEQEHLPSLVNILSAPPILSPDPLKLLRKAHEDYPELFPMAAKLQGLKKSMGTHAAGIIIGDQTTPFKDALPLMRTSGGNVVSQFDMYRIEKLGLLKMDILGLRTLDTIERALDFVHDRYGDIGDIDDLDPYDPDFQEVYESLASGHVDGIFQMEGGACAVGCREVGVREFEDIVAITALYRPGPDRFIGDFIRGRQDPSSIEYLHPKLEPILRKTYGVIVYQEQAMEIGGELAGFDAAMVDEVKETIKAKDPSRFAKVKPLFLEGCVTHSDMDPGVAEQLWDRVESFAGYGYNRAHAVAYSIITFQTAWLKFYYPLEFMTALLATTDKDDRGRYHREARRLKLRVLPPDVNRSGVNYTIEKESIRMGISQVKYCGASRAVRMLAWRSQNGKVRSRAELGEATNHSQAAFALTQAGACSSIGLVPRGDAAELELQYLGDYVSQHPLDRHKEVIDQNWNTKGKVWTIGGLVTKRKPFKAKNGEMGFLDVEYYGDAYNVVVFNSLWPEVKRLVKEGAVIVVKGKKDMRKGQVSIIADEIGQVSG